MRLVDYNLNRLPEPKSLMPKEQQQQLLSQLPNWQINQIEGITQLQCNYKFANFIQAIAFTNKITDLAEQVNHHPSLLIEWGKVVICWWSHDLKGLHLQDFVMAAKTDQVYNAR